MDERYFKPFARCRDGGAEPGHAAARDDEIELHQDRSGSAAHPTARKYASGVTFHIEHAYDLVERNSLADRSVDGSCRSDQTGSNHHGRCSAQQI